MSDYGKEASMIPRALGKQAKQLAQWFPVVSITGPRQSGKSTLAKAMFPDYDYVNLENPETRKAAIDDPVGFIRQRPSKLIVDEAQYAPDLFSMIQVASDERSEQGQYVLSGSQNFLLLKRIQQSLAGRVGLVKLLPFSFQEACKADQALTPDTLCCKAVIHAFTTRECRSICSSRTTSTLISNVMFPNILMYAIWLTSADS